MVDYLKLAQIGRKRSDLAEGGHGAARISVFKRERRESEKSTRRTERVWEFFLFFKRRIRVWGLGLDFEFN